MSNLAFCAASFDNNSELLTEAASLPKKHNKTIKKRWGLTSDSDNKASIQNIINEIHNTVDNDTNDDSDLSDFNPPSPPEINHSPKNQGKAQEYDNEILPGEQNNSVLHDSEPVNSKGLYNLPTSATDSYFIKGGPLYNRIDQQEVTKDELIQKINYMIHLLEEQRDEKTGQVTEEVILYSFLGIFMIFIVDSFARVGKYHR